MKERPILFSGPMVRALLAGTKTQTRRVVKSPFLEWLNAGLGANHDLCPYGQPGDRLWVRETWAEWEGTWLYRADFDGCDVAWKWTPSIHMPRLASRIALEVTAVRVERLQDISEEDAKAEGIAWNRKTEGWMAESPENRNPSMTTFHGGSARQSYAKLWESINGSGSWDANPWVWVVEFKRV